MVPCGVHGCVALARPGALFCAAHGRDHDGTPARRVTVTHRRQAALPLSGAPASSSRVRSRKFQCEACGLTWRALGLDCEPSSACVCGATARVIEG